MDYIHVAETLGIKRQAACSIVTVYLRQGRRDALQRGGYCPSKVDEEIKTVLERILDENPLLTLEQINGDLKRRLPEKSLITRSTLARALDGMLLTMKLAEDVPEGRNEDRVLQQRLAYAQCFLRQGVVGHCIYIDECGYNIWTKMSYGRAPRGQPARTVVNNQRGRNCKLNVTFAISNEVGLVHHSIRLATTTLQSFQQSYQIFLICDNARPHISDAIQSEFNNITGKRTPTYSPFLNLVEMCYSAFKAAVKRTLALPQWQERVGDVAAAAEVGVNMQWWRASLLEEVARQNADTITQEKCARWYNQAQTYLPRCIARQQIDG